MDRKEFCDVCFKEMEVTHSFVREDEQAVEVEYKCKCGYKITFEYWGKFVEMYKKMGEKSIPDAPSFEMPQSDELGENKR
ncbi:MAG: hypothetical protein WC523_04230 [Patescibacteria group bacterium]